jgi:hypothetical protein
MCAPVLKQLLQQLGLLGRELAALQARGMPVRSIRARLCFAHLVQRRHGAGHANVAAHDLDPLLIAAPVEANAQGLWRPAVLAARVQLLHGGGPPLTLPANFNARTDRVRSGLQVHGATPRREPRKAAPSGLAWVGDPHTPAPRGLRPKVPAPAPGR